MAGNRQPDDDDRTAFREAMQGSDIRPVRHDRADIGRTPRHGELRHRREAAASSGNTVTATSLMGVSTRYALRRAWHLP